MSVGDFLSELAARNIGAVDVIAPRRAARFETVQTQGALGLQIETGSFEPTSLDEESARRTPLLPARLPSTREAARSEKASDPEAARILPHSQSEIRSSNRTPAGAPAPQTLEELEAKRETINPSLSLSRSSTPPISSHDAPAQTSLTPDARAQMNQDRIVERAAAQASRALQASTDELKELNIKGTGARNAGHHSPIIATPRVTLAEHRAAESPTHQTGSPTAQEQRPTRLPERADVPSSEPTINVTIGRVEVRAVTSTTPPHKTRTPTPQALSLDEYLRKRRHGGER